MPRVRAPELPKDFAWLNTIRSRSLKELRGRIVLLDFWTYCCINCLHVLPDLKYLEQKYSDSLTIVGVHSAKFENEKDLDNVRQAILRYNIEHPVLMDRDFAIWEQYAVKAYPTFVLIDPEGYVVATIAGEGKRSLLDDLINKLIQSHKIDFQKLDLELEKHHNSIVSPLAFPGKVLADETSKFLFVADSGHDRIVISTLEGEVLYVIGTGDAGLVDGAFDQAQFSAPQGLSFDRANQFLYVADTGNHAIRRIDLKQEQVETIAGTGTQSRNIHPHAGIALETPLNSPWDLELIHNQLFIAMAGSHQIWELNLDTNFVRTFAGTGAEASFDAPVDQAAFAQPSGITTDSEKLFVADSESSSVRSINLSENSSVQTVCGSGDLYSFGDVDAIGETARLQHCLGIGFAQDSLWIADTYNHKIKRVDRSNFCQTVLGTGQAGYQNGEKQNAQFSEPSGISATQTHLYIADTNNHVIRVVELENLMTSTIEFPKLCAPTVCFPDKK